MKIPLIEVDPTNFYAVDTGVADAYVVTLTPPITAIATGFTIDILISNTNLTPTPTLDVNSLGVKNITDVDGTALIAGDLITGTQYTFRYDGINFVVILANFLPLSGGFMGGVIVLAGGTAGVPSIGWINTGFYQTASDVIGITLGGVLAWRIFAGSFISTTVGGPALLNEVASSINPTLIPNRSDDTTGVGWSTDTLVMLAGGISRQTISTVNSQFNVPIVLSTGTSLVPAIGWTDTGFYEYSINEIGVSCNGSLAWIMNTNSIFGSISTSGTILNKAVSSTSPTLIPNRANLSTGIGWLSTDNLSLIAGNIEIFRFSTTTAVALKPIQAVAGTALTPAIGWTNTGFYEGSPDEIHHSLNGINKWHQQVNKFQGADNNTALILNEASSSTNPTICPDKSQVTTGLGSSTDTLHMIVNGVSILSVAATGIINGAPVILPTGSVAAPSIGWTDTGFYEKVANSIGVAIGGAHVWDISSILFGSTTAGKPLFLNEVGSSTNPNICPNAADYNTGFAAVSGALYAIVGGALIASFKTGGISSNFLANQATGKIVATAYLAATDLIVVAWGSSQATITGWSDSNAAPVTTVALNFAIKPFICFPVKKGDYWKVTIDAGSATIRDSALGVV